MKLFKISQTENDDYDTYDSAIVAALSEDDARLIRPSETYDWTDHYSPWCSSPEKVTVEYIGEAREGMEAGVVLASFNAG